MGNLDTKTQTEWFQSHFLRTQHSCSSKSKTNTNHVSSCWARGPCLVLEVYDSDIQPDLSSRWTDCQERHFDFSPTAASTLQCPAERNTNTETTALESHSQFLHLELSSHDIIIWPQKIQNKAQWYNISGPFQFQMMFSFSEFLVSHKNSQKIFLFVCVLTALTASSSVL